MTVEPDKLRVRIGTLPVVLPVHIDRETTGKIAQQVEDRILRIEEESDTVDTQRFAVQAAYEFAAELHDLEQETRADTNALIKALESVAAQLKQLAERYRLKPMAPDKEE